MSVRVSDVARLLEAKFPSWWAEPWDRVGLLIGDEDAAVDAALVTLDATIHAVRAAREQKCGLLVTHHPPYLGDLERVVAHETTGAIVVEACRLGVAVIAVHTNLDRSPEGAAALARACGFDDTRPLERSTEPGDLVTVYAPERAERAIVDAMAAAGAGRIGLYERCAFSTYGSGTFAPLPGAAPTDSTSDAVPEVRIEMLAPPGRGPAVAQAARAVHPYEEPLITVSPIARQRAQAAYGAVAETAATTLASLAGSVARRLNAPARIWGPADRQVSRVAFANGSGGALIPDAIAAGAHALVLGEVRYHDAQRALDKGLCIVELGHDVSEVPLLEVIASTLAQVLGERNVVIDRPTSAGWWVTHP
ncbi:MAG: Nif3-like dinuclear metal center hexameric protein [Coriobacteriia bacterium]|nr:Nif3-like dinuclear metal center hexameric protein [Coriobacteriia bacterium]